MHPSLVQTSPEHTDASDNKKHEHFLLTMGKSSAQKYIEKIEKFKKYKNNKMNNQLKFGLNVLPA